jgi:hypothetical protein
MALDGLSGRTEVRARRNWTMAKIAIATPANPMACKGEARGGNGAGQRRLASQPAATQSTSAAGGGTRTSAWSFSAGMDASSWAVRSKARNAPAVDKHIHGAAP